MQMTFLLDIVLLIDVSALFMISFSAFRLAYIYFLIGALNFALLIFFEGGTYVEFVIDWTF